MRRVFKLVTNYGLFFILILVINSCAHFRIKELEKNTSTPNNFYQFLSLEYLDFAKYELYEMHDEIDANYFSFKSSLSLNEKVFYPENPKDWDIPKKYEDKAYTMFKKITNLVNEKLYNDFPEEFSKMIVGYDCWIEQVEENWQLEHINNCYKKFNQNFNLISHNLEKESIKKVDEPVDSNNNNLNDTVVKDSKTSNTINLMEDTQTYETVVFFKFDKYTLSAEQVIQLEKFVRTAIQNTNMKILVEGHTDTMGPNSYNTKLSIKRANFIKKYLINRNLKNTIETIAFGENKLLVKTSDEIKEKQNRRAELYLK